MKIYDLISNLKFIGIKNFENLEINSLTCDSREQVDNGLYFALKGLSLDGHNYASESVKNGAVCLVVERYVDLPIMQILVENTRIAMSYMSSLFFETNKTTMKFVGVTGTNGKTTTTFLMRDILTKLGKKVGVIGTQGIYIGSLVLPANLTTPDPIFLHKTIRDMADNGCEYCIMEVSAHSIALNKIDDIMFDSVALSNITKDHLDFFLNMENYIKCKASLFNTQHAKLGAINIDTKQGKEISKKSKIDILEVGKEGELKLLSSNQSFKGSEFKVEYKGNTYNIKMNLIGEYNIDNMLLAIANLLNLGFEMKSIVLAIKSCEFFIPGRFNILDLKVGFNVLIDYAHTPDGIKNVLSAIKNLPCSRIITVFGCGGNRDRTKRNEMCKTAMSLSDIVIVTTDNPRDESPEMIIDEITKGIESKSVVKIVDRRSAIEYALSIAKENDVVAILGKGAENYQEIKGVKIPFSDYQVVDNFFKYNTVKGKVRA